MIAIHPLIPPMQTADGQDDPHRSDWSRGIIGYAISVMPGTRDNIAPFWTHEAAVDVISHAGLDMDSRLGKAIFAAAMGDSSYWGKDPVVLTIDEAQEAFLAWMHWSEDRYHDWYEDQRERSLADQD